MGPFPIDPAAFDGARFATRYGLAESGDFWAQEEVVDRQLTGRMLLYLRDGLILPDDPPKFDPPYPRVKVTRSDPLLVDETVEILRVEREPTDAELEALRLRLGATRVERV